MKIYYNLFKENKLKTCMVRLTTCFEIKIIIQTLDLNINYS